MTINRSIIGVIIIIITITIGCNKIDQPILEDIYTINANSNNNYNTYRDSSEYYWQQIKPFKKQALNNEQQLIIKRIEARYYQSSMKFDSASICYEQAREFSNEEPSQQLLLTISATKTALFAKQKQRYNRLLQEAIIIANNTGDSVLIAKTDGLKGEIAFREKKYDNAIIHYKKAVLFDKGNTGLYLYKLGAIYMHKEENALALDYLLRSEVIYKEEKKLSLQATTSNRIVKLYRKTGRFSAALNKQEEILEISQSHNFKFNIYKALNEMSIIYSELKQWDKAEEYFQKALDQAQLINRPKSVAITLNNMGKYYSMRGDLPMAEDYYTKAYKYRLENNIGGKGLLKSIWNLGSLYEQQKDYFKAESLLLQAVNISDSINDLSMSSISHKKLAELYKAMNKTEQSLKHFSIYMLKDKELIAKNSNKQLQETLVKYETKEKELIIVEQKEELNTKNNMNIILGGIAVFFIALIILLVLLYFYKRKNFRTIYKQQNKIEIQKQTINNLLTNNSEKIDRSSTKKLLSELIILLEDEKVYKDPKISLNSLSQKLATNTTYLSNLINSEFKCNYKTLINRYRIDYCKTEICNNKNKDLLIKQIAMEAGFSSLSTFNTIFKKETGMTPSSYQEINIKQSK